MCFGYKLVYLKFNLFLKNMAYLSLIFLVTLPIFLKTSLILFHAEIILFLKFPVSLIFTLKQ